MPSVFIERILWFQNRIIVLHRFILRLMHAFHKFTRNNNVNTLFSNPEIPGFGLS